VKILHSADWHLGSYLGRIDRSDDLERALRKIAGYCASEQAEVVIVAGDLFAETRRLDRLRQAIDQLRQIFSPFLLGGGTILALTGNHDNEDFTQTLRETMGLVAPAPAPIGGKVPGGRLYLANGPTFFRLAGRAGEEVQFVLMPYPTIRRYLDEPAAQFRTVEERNRNLGAAFTARLRGILADSRFDQALPTVLAAHIFVQSAVLPHEFLPTEQEMVELPEGEVPTGCFAYVALGHVHNPQFLMGLPHVRYSGSIERMNLGEAGDGKSVVLADVGSRGLQGEPTCLPLDPTPIYEVVITNPAEELPGLRQLYPDADSALVKCHVTYTAGRDHLDAVLHELHQVFPRIYHCTWQEARALGMPEDAAEADAESRGFGETIIDYLEGQLTEHPQRDELLALARTLLAEEIR
jgi:exonuclease SbcD